MLIVQEENSPVFDLWQEYSVKSSFQYLEELVDKNEVNSTELFVYCEQHLKIVKAFLKASEALVRHLEKEEVRESLKQKMLQGVSLD